MAYGEFYVEHQGWARWPKVLVMCRKRGSMEDGSVSVERRKYVPLRECSVINDIEPRDTTMRVIGSCSECGHILCGSDWCCAHCGARVRGGGDEL